MNQNNNLDDIPKEFLETMSRRISNFGAILIGAAIIGVCFAIAKLDGETSRLLTIIISGAVGAVGIFLMIVAAVGASETREKHNFFLYNRKRKQEMAISELTVSEIRKRLTEFMAAFKYRGKLYIGDLFDERQRIPEHFKTLICYEVLCQIADKSFAESENFLSFGKECADVFYTYLSQNGDYEIALKIKTYILDFSEGRATAEEFRGYIASKKQHFEEKMLDFTVKNIKKFG